MNRSTIASLPLFSLHARSSRTELLDDANQNAEELAANLRDIRRVNRYFGGVATTMNVFPALADSVPDDPVKVLDLGTGSADIPLAIALWAKSNGRSVDILASDASQEVLSVAASQTQFEPSIRLEVIDAQSVPRPDKSFDIVLCSLTLHHFNPAGAVRVLLEMNRLSRSGWILNDLVRSRTGFLLTWLAVHLTTRNRLTRHDAPLSIRRAYTPTELSELVSQAGIDNVSIRTSRWFRMVAVKEFARDIA